VTPAERLARIEEARAEYDAHAIAAEHAHQQLIDEIRAGLEDAAALPLHRKRELGPSAIGRAADYTREYIAQIRDGDPRKKKHKQES
jgi:hypothetical protein